MPCAGNTQGDCYAAVWAQRVVINGGARPSQTTIDAAATFHNALRTAGLLTKIKALNFFAPDSLTAALVPFIKGTGFDIWTNTGSFVAGDITVNGLRGDGVNKYLKTGILPSVEFPDETSAGLTFYRSEGTETSANAIGGQVGFTQTLNFFAPYTDGTFYFEAWQDAVNGYVTSSNLGLGYYSGNRTTANDKKIYFASGTTTHYQAGSGTGTAGTRPDRQLYVFALNDNNSPAFLSGDRYSMMVVHLGFTQAESLALYNAVVALRTALGGGFVPDPNDAEQMAVDWASRVVKNGGALPSANTISAAQTFYQALIDASIHTKMKGVNIVAPDNLTAAFTPLIKGSGLDPWTNVNFVNGDLTVNGLAGGGTRVANTGLVPASIYSSDNNGGLTIYNYTSANGTYCWMGVYNSDGQTVGLDHYNNEVFWDCYSALTTRITVPAATNPGYWSGNRTAANSSNVYFANSGTAHSSVGSTAASGGTRPNIQYFAWALNANTTTVLQTPERLSFLAAHDGLSATESLALYNAVQALRTSLGGGYV